MSCIMVTNQNHYINHDIIVKTLGRYLHIDEVGSECCKRQGFIFLACESRAEVYVPPGFCMLGTERGTPLS